MRCALVDRAAGVIAGLIAGVIGLNYYLYPQEP